ncbi:MAG: glycosyltransferase [Pseudomonadota bacterium]
MTTPRVTIVISPRERFSLSERALDAIYEHTSLPFDLIYVSGGLPPQVLTMLQRASADKGFELIHSRRFLAPNEARNLAIPKVKSEYVVFLDNDALVAPNWLEHLLACAEETQAALVGPLYMIHEFERATIHMAGGRLTPMEEDGRKYLIDEQYLYDTPVAKADMRLKRRKVEYVEFHCMLARMSLFDQIGLLDPKLYNLHEERDFCLAAIEAGGEVYIEPRSIVTYVPPPPCQWWDLPYFMLRWSEEWSVSSVRLFNKKWDVAGVRHISDKNHVYEEGTVIGFASAWRARVAGHQFSNEHADPIGPLDQARLMVALLASVDRQYYSMDVDGKNSDENSSQKSVPTPDIIFRLSELNDPDFAYKATLSPLRRPIGEQPIVVRTKGLQPEAMNELSDYAFMVNKAPDDTYECWFALANAPQHIAGQEPITTPVTLAGAVTADGDHRLTLMQGHVGKILSERDLSDASLLDAIARGDLY